LFLSTKISVVTEIDIKYCCNTVRAANVRRELVLENATSVSLKNLEFQYQNIVGTLTPVSKLWYLCRRNLLPRGLLTRTRAV